MDKTFKDITEMHNKISNDPWLHARLASIKEEEGFRAYKDNVTKERIADWHQNSRSNHARIDQFRRIQKEECDMLKNIQMEKERIEMLKNNERVEHAIGNSLKINKDTSSFKDRNSQYLRENDPQLRKLAYQLREAYVNKVRLDQIDEKEKIKNELAKSDLPFLKAVEEKQQKENEIMQYEQFLEEEKKYILRRQLETQMKEKERFEKMNDTTEEDRQRIEAIITANLQEMKLEKEQAFEKKQKFRDSVMETIKIRETELEKERFRLMEEEEKLKNYTKFTDDRTSEQKLAKEKRMQMLNEVQNRLGEMIEKKRRDTEEFELARQDVAIAESELASFRHDKLLQEAREKNKLEYIRDLNNFIESNIAAVKLEKQKDRELDREIQRLCDEKDKEIQQRIQKEKEKNEIFKTQCKEDIDRRRLEKKKCHEESKKEMKEHLLVTQAYDDSICQERRAMIKEMAPYLVPGCIPRGMLRPEDIEYLEEPLKSFLLSKQSYPNDTDTC